MPSSLLNPVIGKMDITSDIYDEVMSSVDRQIAVRLTGDLTEDPVRSTGMSKHQSRSKLRR